MKLPSESRTNLNQNLKICRILNGMWQVSGAHGYINKDKAIKSMERHIDNGFITWDLADHYGPAEDYVRILRKFMIKQKKEEALNDVKFFTKWVPRPQKITRVVVEDAINLSRRRMGMDVLDMIQFHWWDYHNKNYLKAIEYLDELRQEEIIMNLGLTNFDTEHVKEFLNMGINIITNQVQYSLIDRRPEKHMAELCKKYGIKLLAYGTLCGGLLTERYLGKAEPNRQQLNTASLYKYKNMIDRWGDWNLFQKMLITLKNIANKHNISIANVAVRYILENPIVAGAIIGVRLGITDHIEENSRIFSFSLDQEDIQKIDIVSSKSNNLFQIIGDCGDEYRS